MDRGKSQMEDDTAENTENWVKSRMDRGKSKMEDDTTENIEDWVIGIHRQLEKRKSNRSRLPRTPTIFMVPPNLRAVQKSAFVPKIISIGLYHSRIDTMYEHKMQCLLHILEGRSGEIKRSPERDGKMEPRLSAEIKRSSESDSQLSVEIKRSSDTDREMKPQSCKSVLLDDLVKAIRDLEPETRDCYSHRPKDDLSPSDFVRMMVIDGCFLIELLRLHNLQGKPVKASDQDKRKKNQLRCLWIQRAFALMCSVFMFLVCRMCRVLSLLAKASHLERMDMATVAIEGSLDEDAAGHSPLIWNASHNVDRDSPILTTRWLLRSLQCDIIKLENQIPYLILEKLFSLTSPRNECTLQQLLQNFFSSIWSENRSSDLTGSISMDYAHRLDHLTDSISEKFAHPLHHLRSFFICSVPQPTIEDNKLIYSAQELQEAGVSFSSNTDKLLNIKFSEGVLEIPQLSIDETTTTMLLNFVAYEQCDKSQEPFFINYLLFLDSLINTTKDVEILRKNGILKYPLGTEKEVVELFNNFCKEIVYDFDQKYLSVDMDAVNIYCKAFYDSKCRFWWSNLRKEKFSSPWTSLSLLAAIILLTLTMLQTFYTVFPYYHPN